MGLKISKLLTLGRSVASGYSTTLLDTEGLASGNFVVSYRATSIASGKGLNFLQVLSPSGSPAGVATRVSSAETIIDLHGMPDGGFWYISDAVSTFQAPRFSSYDEEGHLVVPEFNPYPGSISGGSDTPVVATANLADGNILVVRTLSTGKFYSQIFKPDFTKVGTLKLVQDTHTGDGGFEVTTLSNGKLAVVWDQYVSARYGLDVFGRILNPDGSIATATFRVNSVRHDHQHVIGLESLGNGKFVSVWHDDASFDTNGTSLARVYNSDGSPAGRIFSVGTAQARGGSAEVESLNDGRFAYLIQELDPLSSTLRVKVMIYDGNGKLCGKPIELESVHSLQPSGPSIFLHDIDIAKQNLMATWTIFTSNQGPSSFGTREVHAKIIDLSLFTGTSANDLWIGGAFKEKMIGSGGDDELDGRGGADALFGGSGNDRLTGGAGKDVLNGGTGNDTAFYSGGKAVKVSLADYRDNSGAALGEILVGIENLVGSSYGDVLIGDQFDNKINGSSGNDSIYGGAGNDRISGGAGADKLSGGAGNDKFMFEHIGVAGDKIANFGAGDSLHFNSHAFVVLGAANLPTGTLDDSYFVVRPNNRASDNDDYFIFRTTDDSLWFDSDGSGGITPVLIATFTGVPDLHHSQIVMF